MNLNHFRLAACVVFLSAAGSAQADYVGALGSITTPASIAFSNSTGAGTLTLHTGTPLESPYNFVDTWSFALLGGASVSSLVAAFNFGAGGPTTFGIDNLQVNLWDNLNNVIVTSWQTVSNTSPFSSIVAVSPSTGLVAGSYSMQVRGRLLGDPGSYAATLIATPPAAVPLPAALPLLLAGAGVFGVAGARRRKQPGAV